MNEDRTVEMPPKIGPYKLLKVLGSGGMGEVFLADDPANRRKIAIKRIRSDLKNDPNKRTLFLNEAYLTAKLTHPAIIPIYAIIDEKETYYTMPFIEGVMLKELFEIGCKQEEEGTPPDYLTTIPALSYAFLEICYAVAFAQSKGVIHRDLKPSNIMIGTFGQAIILDWGLAKEVDDKTAKETPPSPEMKTVDKVAGTLIYTAPELLEGKPASFKTEVYSLGLILYQILTFRYPFHRNGIEEYRKNKQKEVLVSPLKIAPQRHIPPMLAEIALKCLAPLPADRYQSVEELMIDMENYLKGSQAWFKLPPLPLDQSSEWEMIKEQKNPLITMISKRVFGTVFKIEAWVTPGNKSSGIGFLLGVDGNDAKNAFFLWISVKGKEGTSLLKGKRYLAGSEYISLEKDQEHYIQIEKFESRLYVYINGHLEFTYIDYIPQSGPGFGIVHDPKSTSIAKLIPSTLAGGFQISPLAVGNAFFESKLFDNALKEYQRVAARYPYSHEGSRAIFQAGVALIDEAAHIKDASKKRKAINAAGKTFEQLHGTNAGPLESLGKSLLARFEENHDDELLFLENGLAHFAHHPLFPMIKDQTLFRLQETARLGIGSRDHQSFALLVARYLPVEASLHFVKKDFSAIKKQWEPLYFMDETACLPNDAGQERLDFVIRLCFWLGRTDILSSLIDELLATGNTPVGILCNALFALIELGEVELVQQKLDAISQLLLDIQAFACFELVHEAVLPHFTENFRLSPSFLASLPKKLETQHLRVALHVFKEALKRGEGEGIRSDIDQLKRHELSHEQLMRNEGLQQILTRKAREARRRGEHKKHDDLL